MFYSRQVIEGMLHKRQLAYDGHWIISVIAGELSKNFNIQSVYFDEQKEAVRQYVFDFDPQRIIRVVEMKVYAEGNRHNYSRVKGANGAIYRRRDVADEKILIGRCDEVGVLVVSFDGALEFMQKELESYTKSHTESGKISERDRAVIELIEASLPDEMQKDTKNRIKNNQAVPKTDELIDLIKKNAPSHLQWLVREIAE